MRLKTLVLIIGLGMILSAPAPEGAQPLPKIGPPFEELEALWKGFWDAIRAGDLKAAMDQVHSHKRHLFPLDDKSLGSVQEVARQMAYCRLDSIPLILQMMSEEQLPRLTPEAIVKWEANNVLIYRFRCEHRGETAEGGFGVRRDLDGAWRISGL